MNDSNIFQILGLLYSAIGLGMLVCPRFYKEAINKMIDNEAILFVTGLLVLAAGYLVVAYHDVWTIDRALIITIFGWMALLKGLMMTVIPEQSVSLYKAIKITEKQMAVYGAIVFVIGLVCVYLGYFV